MIMVDPAEARAAIESAIAQDRIGRDTTGFSIDGLTPALAVAPHDIGELSQVMAAAHEAGLAVAPWGGGTRMDLGNVIRGLDVVADLSQLNGVVQHNPADLTATVQAGITLSDLQSRLAEHGQFVALDPPLPDRASVGGTLAVGTAGPLKWRFGSPRDLVLGIKTVQSDGTIVNSGGQVVKNVSGYDLVRLNVGALGSLGIIAEVSLRLMPLPRDEATVLAGFDSGRRSLSAGMDIFHSQVMPMALTCFDGFVKKLTGVASVGGSHFVAVRLGGRPRTVQRELSECASSMRGNGAVSVETLTQGDAIALWRRLADFGWEEDNAPTIGGRAVVLPTRVADVADAILEADASLGLVPTIMSEPAYGTLRVGWFTQNAQVSNEDLACILERVRAAVYDAGGRLTIERCPLEVKSTIDVWDVPEDNLTIMRRMKEQYDPKGVLNPGRFVGRI